MPDPTPAPPSPLDLGPQPQTPDMVQQPPSSTPVLKQRDRSNSPNLLRFIQDMVSPQFQAQPGQMARPVSRVDGLERFLGNFLYSLGQGMQAAHGPGAAMKGFGAAATAPVGLGMQQAQLQSQIGLQGAETEQKQAETQLQQAQAGQVGKTAILNIPGMGPTQVPIAQLGNILKGSAAAGIGADSKRDTTDATNLSREKIAQMAQTAQSQKQAADLKTKWDMQTRDLQNRLAVQALKGTQAGTKAAQGLTTSTRTMIEMAPTVKNRVADIRQLMTDPEVLADLGPGAGRWSEMMAGTAGFANPKFTKLRSEAMLLQTALMRMHVGARGSKDMMDHFKGIMDTGKQSPENMGAALDVIDKYADEKVAEGQAGTALPPSPSGFPKAPAKGAPSVQDLIKKYGG